MGLRTKLFFGMGLMAAAAVLAAGAGAATRASAGSDARPNGASSGKHAKALVDVKFALASGIFASILPWIADTQGFFAKEGVQAKYVTAQTGATLAQALATGDVDFTLADVTGAALARKAGVVNQVFVSNESFRSTTVLGCKPGVVPAGSKWPGVMSLLQSKTIGISAPGAGTDTNTRFSFATAGLKVNDQNIIAVGSAANAQAAIVAGRLDCIVANDPLILVMGPSQLVPVVSWRDGQGPAAIVSRLHLATGIATSDKYASEHPDLVVKVSRALKAAVAFARNPRNASTIATNTAPFFPGVDPALLLAMLKVDTPTLEYGISVASIRNGIRVWNKIHPDAASRLDLSEADYATYIAAPVRKQLIAAAAAEAAAAAKKKK